MAELIDIAQSKIEAEVGKFLLIKEELYKLSKSNILTVRDKAKILLVENKTLYNQAFTLLPKLSAMKESKSIDVPLVLEATSLASGIAKHIQKVNALKKEGGKDITTSTMWTTTNIVAAATVGILLMLVFMRRK